MCFTILFSVFKKVVKMFTNQYLRKRELPTSVFTCSLYHATVRLKTESETKFLMYNQLFTTSLVNNS